MGTQSMTEDKVQAGICPNCGLVTGDDVNWNFPNPATCDKCLYELKVAGLVTQEEIEGYTA